MAKVREEIVGKRFLSVSKSCKLKLSKICEWDWRAGVIRACTHADSKHPELQILVEYEDVPWQRREWIQVHKEQAFQILLVEHTLVWAPRNGDSKLRGLGGLYPALEFEALVDEVGLSQTKETPLEYLTDRKLEFHDYDFVRTYQDGECLRLGDEECQEAVRRWVAEQDGQRILCTTPSVLVGFRVQVYRSEGTTQWYTAVIVGYNDATRELTVTDDTVLEEHCEDPSLVHIRLLGEGVVESILRGENVGITPRRSRSTSNHHHQSGIRHNRRDQVTSSRGRKAAAALSSTKVSIPSVSPLQGFSPPSPARSGSPTSPHSLTSSSLKTSLDEQQSSGEDGLTSDALRCFDPCTLSLLGKRETTSPPSLPPPPPPPPTTSPAPPAIPEEKKGDSSHGTPFISSKSKSPHLQPHSPPKVSPPPQLIHSNPNTTNSPNSPTNPDKPTNPRQTVTSDEAPSVTRKESPCRASPATVLKSEGSPSSAFEGKVRLPEQQPEKVKSVAEPSAAEPTKEEKNCLNSISATCSVNNSLNKVVIKLRNNVRLKSSEDHFQDNPKGIQDSATHKVPLTSTTNNTVCPSSRNDLGEKTSQNSLCSLAPVRSLCESSKKVDPVLVSPKSESSSKDTLEIVAKQELDKPVEIVPLDEDQQTSSRTEKSDQVDQASNKDLGSIRKCDGSERKPLVELETPRSSNEKSVRSEEKSLVSSAKRDFCPSAPTVLDECAEQPRAVSDPSKSVHIEVKNNLVDKSPHSNGRVVRHFPVVFNTNNSSPKSTSLPLDRTSVPDFLKVKSNSHRQVILVSSVEGNLKLEEEPVTDPTEDFSIRRGTHLLCPSIGLLRSTSEATSLIVTPTTSSNFNIESNVEVASRLLHADCTLSVSRVGDSSSGDQGRSSPPSDSLSIVSVTATPVITPNQPQAGQAAEVPPRSFSTNGNVSAASPASKGSAVGQSINGNGPGNSSGTGGLTHSLAAAGAVSGRAVTITATSGPAPQGSSRVASPPSVSITAVVRSPPYPHHTPDPAAHHHDGAAASLHHPHPPPQPPYGPLSTGSRMDQGDGSSDSGVSVTERSVSRSSVLSDDRSSSAEVKPNTPTPTPTPVAVPPQKSSLPPLIVDRKESVKVWRNPAVLSQSELSVRHIHSLQHSSAMSQHFPGVPPHIPPPGGPQGVAHAASHPSAHGPPPPSSSSLSHAIVPPLQYPSHHAPASHLHLNPGLQPSLTAAAALYPQLQPDVWKQLSHVGGLAPHAYASLLPRHQEEFSYMEHQVREIEKQHQAREIEKQHQADRIQRDRETREKQVKEKMDRERVERQRKERERRERDEKERQRREWGAESESQLVNKHFEDSFRYASQKLGRENLRQLPSETHPASVFYAQGLTNQQARSHLTHNQSLLISHQQPQQQSQPQQPPPHQHTQPQQNQNKIYPSHLQKGSSHWSQTLNNLSMKVESRDGRQPSRHQTSQPSETLRKVKEPEQFVQESIYKAFRDDPINESHMKSHNPPPAHTKHSSDKSSPSVTGYPVVHFGMKDHKHSIERNPYSLAHEKASVIVQPDLKYDKVAQHSSVSPKQRPPERSSPYSTNPSGPNHYKPYEPSPPPPSRGSTPHHPTSSSSLSPSPHSELAKARQALSSSPHASSSVAHPERYYPGTKPPPPPVTNPYQSNLVSGGVVQNHMHNINTLPSKAKVSSPPQMFMRPGITSGTPVCKSDTRSTPQPLPLNSKALNGPPPAHSGSRNLDIRPPPTSHEQRVSHNRSPFDARHYSSGSGASHLKTGTTLVVSSHSTSRVPTSSPLVASGHHPTQTQPLDLGTRDGGTSPTNRRRSQTPTPQESKRPRLDNMSSPLLSRVSEPSPLYPTAATTITTVENTVALANLQRVSSPVTNSPRSTPTPNSGGKSSSVITNVSTPINFSPSPSEPSSNTGPNGTPTRPLSHPPPSTTPTSIRVENNSSPGSSKQVEPEKCSSPDTVVVGYVHKLKKAWLQRLNTGADISPVNSSSTSRGPTPPPTIANVSTKPSTSLSSVKQEVKIPPQKTKTLGGMPNGHGQESKEMDSSSTDSEDDKIKRNKTKRNIKRTKKSSDSNSDSDKESDGSEGSIKKSENLPMKQDTEPRRRRGRKPKIKQEKDEGFKSKKSKDDPPNDPLQKPPVSQLKKTGESFLQDRSCYEVAPKLPKCRECRWTAHQRNKKMPNIFCRFYAFRRLRYTKNGQLAVAGFSDPIKDAFGEDLRLWVPDPSAPAPDLDCEMSKFLITHVGDQFCDLVQQEKEAMALHMGEESIVAWKRVVQGVREMCDVCETTLFNIHWACSKCGFVVCIDCYKGRKEGTVKLWDTEEGAKERDKFSWLLCASRVLHEQDKLMLTQIIAGNALIELGKKIHEIRYKWGIPMYCGCPEANKYKEKEQEDKKLNGINKDLIKNIKKEPKCEIVNGSVKLEKGERMNGKDDDMSNSPLNFFADVALSNDKRESETSNSDSDSDSDDKETQPSTLRKLLIDRPNSKSRLGGKEESGNATKSKEPSKKKAKLDTLDDVISCVIERGVDKDSKKDPMKVELKHFIRKYNYNRKGRDPLPIRIMTKTESRLLYPNVPHSWLCDGKLLRLHDPLHLENVMVFQDQWKRGQPVIVSGSGQTLNADLWKPQSFSKDFGEVKNNLINCITENIVPNQPMKKFWDGFENFGKRLKDERGQPMVLKLKDWPPTEDFAEMLPSRFEDLMKGLPMGQYTRRNGSLNLAGRLPDCFVRPDLGPKMYIAYGSASYPGKASTNLHLDISDAVNVMCYVGIPKDVEYDDNVRDTLKAIDEAGCDILTRQRVREKEETPGALWHIYHARDADKIRDLLNKVAIERGKKLEPYHDPIHDQSWYLDGPLRERLYKEYAVEGYAIVQCMGDAVFIPAGAPHQVRNLQNCVKVAEDFVSPENVSHCFHLTQEFRHLSDTHTNHEDKLQIKNIIYHAMKDSIASLMASEQSMESKVKKKEANDS